jgi:hypothetical protein
MEEAAYSRVAHCASCTVASTTHHRGDRSVLWPAITGPVVGPHVEESQLELRKYGLKDVGQGVDVQGC